MQNPPLPEYLLQANRTNASIQMRYDGLLKLFEAACLGNNNELAETVRTEIHVVVDALLDSKSGITQLVQRFISQGNTDG